MMSLLRRLAAFLLLACAPAWASLPLPPPEPGKLSVYFFDVGQGDAALIVSPTGKTVLVDGGPPDGGALSRRLRTLIDGPLDLMLLSHPHLDHLGGLGPVIDAPGTRRYMDPGFEHATSSYRDLLQKLGEAGVPLLEPELGEEGGPFALDLGGEAKLTVLWPRRPEEPFLSKTRSDANANSIVFRIDHGDVSFLFTGDAEADTESRLLRSGQKLAATVLKAPHHGSRHSSQEPFLRRVAPRHVVVSCGRNNEYRHPHEHALRRYRGVNAIVHRTDEGGDILAVSDGRTVQIAPAAGQRPVAGPGPAVTGGDVQVRPKVPVSIPRAPPEPVEVAPAGGARAGKGAGQSEAAGRGRYAASRRSEVFHTQDCATVRRIKPHNIVWFDSRAEAGAKKRPAGDCKP